MRIFLTILGLLLFYGIGRDSRDDEVNKALAEAKKNAAIVQGYDEDRAKQTVMLDEAVQLAAKYKIATEKALAINAQNARNLDICIAGMDVFEKKLDGILAR